MAPKNQPIMSDDPFASNEAAAGNADVIDFTEIEGGELMEDHETIAQIVKSEVGASNAGHKKIVITWKLLDGPYIDRTLVESFSFHPNAASISKQRLIQMGLPRDYKGALQGIADMLLEAQADVKIGTQKASRGADGNEYDARNKIARVKNVQLAGSNGDQEPAF